MIFEMVGVGSEVLNIIGDLSVLMQEVKFFQ
jgi:hypothetical protein